MRWTTNAPPVSLRPPKSGLHQWAEGVNRVHKSDRSGIGWHLISHFAQRRVLLITGPTTAGKSTLRFQLRKRHHDKFQVLPAVDWRPPRYHGELGHFFPSETLPEMLKNGVKDEEGHQLGRLALVYNITEGKVYTTSEALDRIRQGDHYIHFRGILEASLVGTHEDPRIPMLIIPTSVASIFLSDVFPNAVCVHLIIDREEAERRGRKRGLAEGDLERIKSESYAQLVMPPGEEWRYKALENPIRRARRLEEDIVDEIAAFALQAAPGQVRP